MIRGKIRGAKRKEVRYARDNIKALAPRQRSKRVEWKHWYEIRTKKQDEMYALQEPVRAYCREELERIIDSVRPRVFFKVLLISSSAGELGSVGREKDDTKTAQDDCWKAAKENPKDGDGR